MSSRQYCMSGWSWCLKLVRSGCEEHPERTSWPRVALTSCWNKTWHAFLHSPSLQKHSGCSASLASGGQFIEQHLMLCQKCKFKGIVHPKMKILSLSAYSKGIQNVGEFVSSVEHNWRLLTQTFAVCQSYNGSQWDSWLWEKKHTQTKTKLNPAARDNTLRSKDTKWSVCARNWTVFILYLPLIRHTVQLSFFLLCGGSQTYKCITATYLSNGPLKLYLQSQLGVAMVHLRDRWRWCTYKSVIRRKARRRRVTAVVNALRTVGPEVKHYMNLVQFLAQTGRFVSLSSPIDWHYMTDRLQKFE